MKPSNVRELLLSNNNYRDFVRLAGIRDSVLANLSTILTVSGKSVVKHKNNLENGPIGTMSESILHHCLKNYVDENVDNHEVFIENYFADIQNGNEITEIQTKSLYKLKPKLNAFLENYDVCVVYPLIRNKWITYMDVKDVKSCSFDFETFKEGKIRKSPLKCNIYDVFEELYGIKDYLTSKNIKVHIFDMDILQINSTKPIKNGRRKPYSRLNKIPLGINDIYTIDRYEDWLQFLPLELGEEFTSKDFSACCNISSYQSSLSLRVMNDIGVVERVGKKGRCYLYNINESLR